MEDEWIEFYSDISNIEDYYETFDIKNPTHGFVNRKFLYWIKYYQDLKKKDPKYYSFYYGEKLDFDVLAFDMLTDEEKKVLAH